MKNKEIIIYVIFYFLLISTSIGGVNLILTSWVGHSLTTGLNSVYAFKFISVLYFIIILVFRKKNYITKSLVFCTLLLCSILYNIYNYYGERSLVREIRVFRESLNNYNSIGYDLIYINSREETLKTIALYKYQNQIPDKCFQVYYRTKFKAEKEFYILRVNGDWYSTDSEFEINSNKDNLTILKKTQDNNDEQIEFREALRYKFSKNGFTVYSSEIASLSHLKLFQYFHDFLSKNNYPIVQAQPDLSLVLSIGH